VGCKHKYSIFAPYIAPLHGPKNLEKNVVIIVFVGNVPINGILVAIAIYVRANATRVFIGNVYML
jgi:hypothetical protein